jgi:hypothetical protein
MDLAHELSALAAHVEWPATPELQLELTPRRSRRRPALALAFAVVLAIAVAFAVPQSRAAILRFFHLGAVTVRVVDTLPPAQERPLGAGLGPVITLAEAKQLVPELLLPQLAPEPVLHSPGGAAVALVFRVDGRPVLLSEYGYGSGFIKKMMGGATHIESLDFDGAPALWISGAGHNVYFPGTSPRLAGNVLVWERGSVTYRLEGTLSKSAALELARSLRHY